MTNWVSLLNHPLLNVVVFLSSRPIAKFLDLENPSYLNTLRGIYLGSQLVIIVLSFYLMSVIKKKNDRTSLRYVEPGGQSWDGTETEDTLVNTTNMANSQSYLLDYDIDQVKKQMKQSFTGVPVIAFLHLKFGYVQPLLIQSVMAFKTFFMSKESRIHFFGGNTSRGELRRPFRIEAPFNMVSEKKQPKTDKGSIKRAEKALKAQ
ncbi:inorganic phosphate transporter Pho88 [Mycotypha africana]|uniref:inorganic phosphate transporter Pho88 n=1 Tax=Mycotypha africana TaxID=64632 RepID=UPI0023004017|nr:inorganic phosphate transporter Pho88 [Mycotypha africana]KAI8970468.1 inorganic phosphate transporter Pho88 [Mycotypha africana]